MRSALCGENDSILNRQIGPHDWADDLADGKLSTEQLNALVEGLPTDRGSLLEQSQQATKLALAGELDHRAGQLQSAEARATVTIAAAGRILNSLSKQSKAGWLAGLVKEDERIANAAHEAASQAHVTLGGLARDRGDLGVAEEQYKEALESAQSMRRGDLATGVAMMELGHTNHLQGREQEAADLLTKAHPLLVKTQHGAYIPLDTYLLGLALAGLQRWDEALKILQETEAGYAQRSLDNGVLDARLARTDILIRTGQLETAEALATETVGQAQALQEPRYVAQAKWHLSRIRRAEKKPDEAISLITEAIGLYEQAGDEWHVAQSYMALAEIHQQEGRIEEADHSLDEAERVAKEMKSPFLEADCLYSRGFLRLKAGQGPEGRHLLEDAKEMFAAQGRPDRVRSTVVALEQLRG